MWVCGVDAWVCGVDAFNSSIMHSVSTFAAHVRWLMIELTRDLATSDRDLGHVAWQKLQKMAGMATRTAMYEMILIEHFVS